jgi:putative glutamine amidotransferase
VEEARDIRYGPAHEIDVVPGGLLESILGAGRVTVNSVHGQGIHRLAQGMRIEALAPDGVIEAIHSPTAPGFNLGVQWHPEWQAVGNPVSEAIFRAFANACRLYRSRRLASVSPA